MEAYTIEVSMTIKQGESSGYSVKTLAESTVRKIVTCYARDVRKEATNIVRTAVDNMSHSTQTALNEKIKTEVVDVSSTAEPEALEI